MITGFNTDIDYEGITYHVQTEDKGLATPVILSLVYNRGTILASKRSPYEDLLAVGFDEKVLAGRLKKQHNLICAAIRAGRIEDLVRMTMKDSASRQKGLVAQKEVKSIVEKRETITLPTKIAVEEIPLPAFLKKKPPFVLDKSTEIALEENSVKSVILPTSEETVWDIPLKIVEEPLVEVVRIVEEETILPAEAVEIINDLGKHEEPDDKLKIELLNETAFKGGERKTISLMVRRGTQTSGLGGAQILVKIIGSSFRPLIFHAKTDRNGVAIVHLQLPHFHLGRAAILVRAMSEGEETELRRIIHQG